MNTKFYHNKEDAAKVAKSIINNYYNSWVFDQVSDNNLSAEASYHGAHHIHNVVINVHNLMFMQGLSQATDEKTFDHVRATLIAALYHDQNHSNRFLEKHKRTNDYQNVATAISCLLQDRIPSYNVVALAIQYIQCTVYDSVTKTFPFEPIDEYAKCLRDADVLWTFVSNEPWEMLAKELNLDPVEDKHLNDSFLTNLTMHTTVGEKVKMEWMAKNHNSFNLNDDVCVTLTAYGANVYKRHLESLFPGIDIDDNEFEAITGIKKLKAGDKAKFSLWEIMHIFGSSTYCGSDICFVDNNIVIKRQF